MLIDRDDYALLKHIGKLFPTKNSDSHFISIRGRNKKLIGSVHRWVMRKKLKDNPLLEVDHINGNPLDNRKSNLRLCTREENCRNRRNRKDHKSSRYKGVGKSKRGGNFYACITKKGKRYHLGTFEDERKAGLAYNMAAFLLYGDFACYNDVGLFEEEEVEELYEEIKDRIY